MKTVKYEISVDIENRSRPETVGDFIRWAIINEFDCYREDRLDFNYIQVVEAPSSGTDN